MTASGTDAVPWMRNPSIAATFVEAFPDVAGDQISADIERALAELGPRGLIVRRP